MTIDTEVLLHALWGKAVGAPGYDKKQWLALSEDIERYAQGGYKQSFDAIASLTHHAGFAGEIVDRVRCALTRLHSSQTQIATQATQLVELQEKLKEMEAVERGERVLVEAIHDATQGIDSMHIGHYPEAVRHLRRLYDVEKERADRNETALKRATRTLGVVCTPEQLPEYVARLFEASRCHSERANKAEAERDAYKRAKAENDDRYMGERDQARAEADALRAEVAALRGLPESVDFMTFTKEAAPKEPAWLIREKLEDLLATVPPAKVAEAVKPRATFDEMAASVGPLPTGVLASREAPKPEPVGLEPLKYKPGNGFTGDVWEAVISRVNDLSAIAQQSREALNETPAKPKDWPRTQKTAFFPEVPEEKVLRAENKSLREELTALRNLPESISALDLEADMPGKLSATERYRWIVRWALAKVPRTKIQAKKTT